MSLAELPLPDPNPNVCPVAAHSNPSPQSSHFPQLPPEKSDAPPLATREFAPVKIDTMLAQVRRGSLGTGVHHRPSPAGAPSRAGSPALARHLVKRLVEIFVRSSYRPL